jgi:hypothetical protein
MILLNYIGILLLSWAFLVIIVLMNEGHLGAFFFVLIWLRSFMELLLGWIVHTQYLLSDPWIGMGQMNFSGIGLKDNLCLPMMGIDHNCRMDLTHICYFFWSDTKGYLAVGNSYGSCDGVINIELLDCIS